MWTVDLDPFRSFSDRDLEFRGALSFEIAKCESTIQSESLIKGEHGPLIWLHFGVLDTESWRSQGDSRKNREAPFGIACVHR
jgi:hypothetical protein